ncbi:hypothetical protein [Rivibacter subsaxonicus]|uniref:hypothetical protein n=1 Tax=Rivibacter subsaxonicus TaxID=457575 RepID=UPI00102D06FB|nr:hypothetical protein [Rivibacter subsaxonicus]
MILSAAGEVDLENARIVQVERSASQVSIYVSSATVEARPTASLTLELLGVTAESAVLHVAGGGEVPLDVGSSLPPLNLVEVWSEHDGTLELQGYRDREPWVVWRLSAKSIRAKAQV